MSKFINDFEYNGTDKRNARKFATCIVAQFSYGF